MARSELTLEETRRMLLHVCERMIESQELLTQADQAIGDGDHGIGMARGFSAVRQKIDSQAFSSLADLVHTVGMTLLTSVGGASGAIFGCFFMAAARSLKDCHSIGAAALSLMLVNGLQEVRTRGKANPGDKTMVDALEPAAERSKQCTAGSLADSLAAVTQAARRGMEATKQMVANTGKAKTLGDRSVGYPDPGALSACIILDSMSEYVSNLRS
jgi:phosphoenolpyruvate---glycerone phosphotransferase subunit DhaL